eukprot:scaffold834_cov123-Cylindrotheca_fusiformis.AAC.38
MKAYHLFPLLIVEAAASSYSGTYKSNSRFLDSFLARHWSQDEPSPQTTTLSRKSLSALLVRGGDDDPCASSFIYSEMSSQRSESEDDALDGHHYGPIVASSQVMYESGCFVSSESLRPDEIFNGFSGHFGDSDDEDDDDDDDNDGHSSMLSNSSLRRSRVLADGRNAARSREQSSTKYSSSGVLIESVIQLQQLSPILFGLRHSLVQR